MSDKKFYRIENKIDRIIFATEDNIEKHYKEAADAIKKEIADLYEQHGELTNATMNKYNRLDSLQDKLADAVQQAYQANRKEINASLRHTFLQTTRDLITVANEETGKQLQPITKSKRVTEVINSKVQNLSWRERMGKHQGDVIYELKKEVGAGIEQGDTYSELAKRIQKKFDVDENRAKLIARNETARVKSASEKETMDSINREGVKMMKTWNSVLDERSREEHVDMDGVTIPYEDNFKLPGGVEAPAPRLSGAAFHDINCRCFVSYDFADKKEESGVGLFDIEEEIAKPDYIKEMSKKGWFSSSETNLHELDVEVVEAVHQKYEKTFKKFPELKGQFEPVKVGRVGAGQAQYFGGTGRGQVTLNRSTFKDYETYARLHQGNTESGHFPKDLSWESIVTHEIGHAIDDYLTMEKYAGGFNMKTLVPNDASQVLRREVLSELGLRQADVGDQLSRYATKNHKEFFAEAYAEYMDSPNPRPIAKVFGEKLERLMKEVAKQ